jgi:hypothetical protein
MNEGRAPAADPADAPKPWTIGADKPLQSFLQWPGCPPLLRNTLADVLSWQTRVETSVRRGLTSPRTEPQWLAALLALGATVNIEGDDGPAEVRLEVLLSDGDGSLSDLHVPPAGG